MTPRDTVVVKRMKMMIYFWNLRYCTASGPIRPCSRFSWKVRILDLLESLTLDLLLSTWFTSSPPTASPPPRLSSTGLATKVSPSSTFASSEVSQSCPSLTSSEGSLSLEKIGCYNKNISLSSPPKEVVVPFCCHKAVYCGCCGY